MKVFFFFFDLGISQTNSVKITIHFLKNSETCNLHFSYSILVILYK